MTATVKASTPRGEPATTDVGAAEMSAAAAAMETTTAAAMETAASAAVETTASAPMSATTTVSRHRIGCHAHGANGDACEQHQSDFGGFGDGTK